MHVLGSLTFHRFNTCPTPAHIFCTVEYVRANTKISASWCLSCPNSISVGSKYYLIDTNNLNLKI
jgi:hypothetical protein